MNLQRKKQIFLLLVGAALIIWGIVKLIDENKLQNTSDTAEYILSETDISILTSEEKVVEFVRDNGELPDYYLSKGEARKQGWVAAQGNLCRVLPGKAIGGDRFGNREGLLPNEEGRIWYEADLNYECGRRGADRLLYSNDGLIYVSYDHYKTFEKK